MFVIKLYDGDLKSVLPLDDAGGLSLGSRQLARGGQLTVTKSSGVRMVLPSTIQFDEADRSNVLPPYFRKIGEVKEGNRELGKYIYTTGFYLIKF